MMLKWQAEFFLLFKILFYYLCIIYAVQKVLIITHKYIVSDIQAMFVLYCFILHFLIEFVNYVNVNEKSFLFACECFCHELRFLLKNYVI